MPTCYMLIGLPASGKSTWINNQDFTSDYIVLSTDNFIESVALSQGLKYNDVIHLEHKNAKKYLNLSLLDAIAKNKNIIWDQTNLTQKVRQKKLSKLPKTYNTIAIYFEQPADDIHRERLKLRPGKTIPENIMLNMKNSLEPPSISEGFSRIIYFVK